MAEPPAIAAIGEIAPQGEELTGLPLPSNHVPMALEPAEIGAAAGEVLRIVPAYGQSLAIGYPAGPRRDRWRGNSEPDAVLDIDDGFAACGWLRYDGTRARASRFVIAEETRRQVPVVSTGAVLARHLRQRGEPRPRIAVRTGGLPGLDFPGLMPGSIYYRTLMRWVENVCSVAAASGLRAECRHFALIHGTASRFWRAGAYRRFLRDLERHVGRDICRMTGQEAPPVMILTQSGGSTTCANPLNRWEVKLAQLEHAAENPDRAVLALAEHALPILDNKVHPTLEGHRILGEMIALAMLAHEAGERWTIGPPELRRTGPRALVADFDRWLRPGEALEEQPDRYQGRGLEALGLEVRGTEAPVAVRDVELCGRQMRIILDAVPEGPDPVLVYAMQIQDVTGFDDGYTAHRGLLATDWSLPSSEVEGETLKRHIPGFRLPIPPLG